MLRTWAAAINNKRVRAGLILFGVGATLALGPLALTGAMFGGYALMNISSDPIGSLAIAAVGFCGLFAIIAAWARVLIPGHKFRSSPWLLWGTALGLGCGLVVAAFLSFAIITNPSMTSAWFAFAAFIAGGFLLGATLGERRNAL